MKGKYYCELYDGTRRRSLCLHTSDPQEAAERYGRGMQELRAKIRREHDQAKEEARPAWLPNEAMDLRASYKAALEAAADAPLDPQEMAYRLTGRKEQDPKTGELLDRETEELAEVIAGMRELPLTWEDLVSNAVTVQKRKQGKDYSKGWYRNINLTITRLDFSPLEATPQRIRQWMDAQEDQGIGSVTLKNRLSGLQGLVERAITSGFRPDLAPNPFKQVDFSVSKTLEQQGNYYCPTLEDYKKLFTEVLPKQPERIAVGIELMAWTGVGSVAFLTSRSLWNLVGFLFLMSMEPRVGAGSQSLWIYGHGVRA